MSYNNNNYLMDFKSGRLFNSPRLKLTIPWHFFLFWYLLAPHLAICSNDLQIKITHLKVFVDRYSSSKRLSCSTRISVAQNGVNSNLYLSLLRTSLKHLHIGALLCCEIATHYFLETVPVVLLELY